MDYGSLIWVTLQRCKTAREAILMFDQRLGGDCLELGRVSCRVTWCTGASAKKLPKILTS